jgi:hypothetical protein
MKARTIEDVKYIALINNNNLKLKSLNDCVYYTLRDIFWNTNGYYHDMANDLISKLIKTTDENNRYTNMLDELHTIRKIYRFLISIKEIAFYFADGPLTDDEHKYLEYTIWNDQLQELIKNLEKIILEKINNG